MCLHCAVVESLRLPASIAQFVRQSEEFTARHRDCPTDMTPAEQLLKRAEAADSLPRCRMVPVNWEAGRKAEGA